MSNTIVTSDKPSTSSPFNPPSRIICHVCQKQFSQYTCPRCNSRYCSLPCYKSHSLRCTESFMRENVVDELQQLQSDDVTKQKMLDILKRFHSEEETDDMAEEDATLSEETIQKVLSGGEVTFDDLSAEEKKRFQRAIASGELSKMIEPWEPWWLRLSARKISLSKEGTQLVQPLDKNEEASESQEHSLGSNQDGEIPPGPETPLPPVSKLSSTTPSPFLAVHLVDIIYSYCFTMRLYNGDWKSDAIGTAMVVLSVSSVLGQGGQPETVSEVVSYCLEQACSPAFRRTCGLQFGILLMDDVVRILSLGGRALLCLLADLKQMVEVGERKLKSEKPRESRRMGIRSKFKLAERKIYFMMCWVHEQTREAWSSLSALVEAEKSSVIDFQKSSIPGGRDKMNKNAGTRDKVLVEEIK